MAIVTGIMLAFQGASLAYGVYQNKQAANEEARAAEQNAAANRLQAQELLRQSGIEEERRRLSGRRTIEQQRAMMRGDIMRSTSNLRLLSETAEMVELDILRMQRDAQFAADQIELGALDFEKAAGDIRKSASTQSLGTLLTGSANLVSTADMLRKKSPSGIGSGGPRTGIRRGD